MTNRAPTPSQPGSNLEDPVVLREAAQLLREAVVAATAGPWTTRLGDYVVVEGPDGHAVSDVMPCPAHGDVHLADARWIALMSPAIAGPLAAWLDEAASQFEYLPPRRHSAQALDVARAIVKAAQR